MPYKDKEKQRQAQRESHLRRRETRRLVDQAYREIARKKIRAMKDVPCSDCGKKYPYYVMDFDHVRGEKINDISKLMSNRQYKKAYDEAEKCEIVCANCHRERSWRRMTETRPEPDYETRPAPEVPETR